MAKGYKRKKYLRSGWCPVEDYDTIDNTPSFVDDYDDEFKSDNSF